LLRRNAAAQGAKIVYRDALTSVSYADLLERTGKLAGHLADAGIEANDAVAIMLPNSVAWAESCLAAARRQPRKRTTIWKTILPAKGP
jgi:acyl-CoA synthetase (AMP-forming)/AMP-acid ligase II